MMNYSVDEPTDHVSMLVVNAISYAHMNAGIKKLRPSDTTHERKQNAAEPVRDSSNKAVKLL